MTKKQLCEKLAEFDDDLIVCLAGDYDIGFPVESGPEHMRIERSAKYYPRGNGKVIQGNILVIGESDE